jgi:hypothetical protein
VTAGNVLAFPIFDTVPLETLEYLVDLELKLGEIAERLSALEPTPEADPPDPVAMIVARLDAFDARLKRMEDRYRRPPAFPISVVSNVVGQDKQQLQTQLKAAVAGVNEKLSALNDRLDRARDEFCRMRERVTKLEGGGD